MKMTKITFNKNKNHAAITIAIVVTMCILVALGASLLKNNKPSQEAIEASETASNSEISTVHLESPVKIPEENASSTIPEESDSSSEPMEELQEYTGELEPISLTFAENLSHFTNGVSLGDITLGGGMYCAKLGQNLCFERETYQMIGQHPYVIPLWVLDTQNSPFGNIDRNTGNLYFIELDGIVFPEASKENPYVFAKSLQFFLMSLERFRTYLDSDLIPDENGIIHGYLYITDKIQDYDNSFNFGQEINYESTVTFQEVLLALGLAAPDRTYDGVFSDIYNQYSDFEANYEGYPLFRDVPVSNDWETQRIYRYQSGCDYSWYCPNFDHRIEYFSQLEE